MDWINFRNSFLRIFIEYYLEEVKITPLEDFEINPVKGNAIGFIEGEERKLPRWIAKILSEKGKIHIKEEGKKELISKLSTYQAEEASRSLLGEIEENFYLKMKNLLIEMQEKEEKDKIINIFKRLMEQRLPKIAKKTFFVGTTEKLSKWETLVSKMLLKLKNEWTGTPLEENERLEKILE